MGGRPLYAEAMWCLLYDTNKKFYDHQQETSSLIPIFTDFILLELPNKFE